MFRIITDARQLREYVLLRDGQGVMLRMATPADVPALETLLARVSRESLRMRFMGGVAQVPRRFARVARRVSRRKPVLCVKSARSRAGRSAARAHIGATPLSDVEVEALFQQAGVIRADTLEELFDVAALLAHQPLPAGNRVAILGNSGGAVTITADACEASGLEVSGPGLVDLGPLAGPEDYRRAAQRALEDHQVDAIIAIFLCVGECEPQLIGRGIRRGVIGAETKTGVPKPALLCLMGATGAVEFAVSGAGTASGRKSVFPSYRFPEAAARALAHAVEYAAYRRQPPGRLVWFEDVDPPAARNALEKILAAAPSPPPTWLSGESAAEVLHHFRIPVRPPAGGKARAKRLRVSVRPHRDFGPLLAVRRGDRPPVERITPLTDQDVRGMLEAVGLSPQGGEAELLGWLSQLVEEMPWLVEMHAALLPAEAGDTVTCAGLGDDVRIAFTMPD